MPEVHVTAIYGVTGDEAAPVVHALEKALGTAFEARTSDYLGDYWIYEINSDTSLCVSYNEDPMFRSGDPEGEFYFHPAVSEHSILITINAPLEAFDRYVGLVFASASEAVLVRRQHA